MDAIPADKEGVDIGPETCKLYTEAVKSAKTVVWNGPMGVFENPTLAAGTIAVAKALAETDATTIIGRRRFRGSSQSARLRRQDEAISPQAAAHP